MKIIAASALPTSAETEKTLQIANDAELTDIVASGALQGVERIELHFPKFTDGRAFSQAVLLRRRHGFAGDIRGSGDVLIDLLVHMHRSGFSSAGTEASVSALTRVPNTAMNQPSRYSLKYSHSRASRAFKGRCAAGETGGALGRGSVGVLGMAVRRFYEARGNSRARAAVKHTV